MIFCRPLRPAAVASSCSCGAGAWIVTENLCDRTDTIGYFFRWFPGHFLWHTTVAYGMTNALLLAGVLRADNFRPRVYIRMDNCYFFLLPRLKFDSAGGIVHPDETDFASHSAGPPLVV